MTDQVKASSWTAVLDECPPSTNEILRTHFRTRAEIKEKFCILLWKAFFNSGISKASGKRRIILRIRSKKERDVPNNYTGADKYILDNLVLMGWLKDDSPKWMELQIIPEVGKPQTIVEISEVLA